MTSLTYTVVVQSGPDAGLGHERALRFIDSLLNIGHQLNRVFFYGEGVRVALHWDDDSLSTWQHVAQGGCELVLCSASAERYGVEEPPAGFVIAGLGTLMEAGLDSDRVLSFA